jgi:hypothetical protein
LRKVLRWTGIVVIGLIALSIVGSLLAPGAEDKDERKAAASATTEAEVDVVKTVEDVEGNRCAADKTKYGRCPSSPDYGKTMVAARNAKAARAKATAAREAAARKEAARIAAEEQAAAAEAERQANAWKQGYEEYSDGIAVKWDNSVCDSNYYTCFGMRLVTRDGCDSLFVTLQLQDSAGNAVGTALDSATSLMPGQVALLDFTAFEENADTAHIAEINCY